MDLDRLDNYLSTDGVVFLTYGGFLSQALIASMTEALEREAESNDVSMKVSNNIFTIFIELSQNMMNYSKMRTETGGFDPKGLIVVGFDEKRASYYVISRNIVSRDDKEKIAAKISLIEGKDKDELKTIYRELRKTGRDRHQKGAGIGFIEIARRCDKIEHKFEQISDDRYYFVLKATIEK